MALTTSRPPLAVQKIYKVSELTREIRIVLEAKYRVVWIEGEVSNFKRHSSGHIYFTLKDEQAQMNAVFFATQNQFLKFDLKDGLQVICIGHVSVYDKRGQYQLYVQRVEQKGLGALQLAYEQLKERLEREGLFDVGRKRQIPLYPRRIGIVTSPTGAAIQDMLKIFRKRTYGLEIVLCPVRVQGEGAGDEIKNGIRHLNELGQFDVLIVGRGGGSLEDLWSFNEEMVARAIYESRVPVISAVGHEVDWTISDFVADFRAHKPTAAAEHIVAHWDQLEKQLRQIWERMQNQMRSILEGSRDEFRRLKDSYAFRQPKVYLQQLSQRADELLRQLHQGLKGFLERKRHEFQNAIGRLRTLSPLSILDRGYSVTFNERGELLKDIKNVSVKDRIRTKWASGTIWSEVFRVGE